MGAPIGVTISLVITIVISLWSENGEYCFAPPDLVTWCKSETAAVVVQTICSMAIGAVFAGTSVLWEIEKWSVTKQTLVHFSVCIVVFLPLSYVLNWMPHRLFGALLYVAVFMITYVLIWVSQYFSMRAKIKKMNKQLQELQQEDKKED